eukprot:TRINITY_DN21737_c0_g1_i1.p1 TRINITY_DN21737_c0_g1~~TRINITY_DN21737_c0_g1_i1.p1  ORF type:complete len:199 (+),score=42.66 TRINITY_DN21737_c0_g1_i1:32-628(+)
MSTNFYLEGVWQQYVNTSVQFTLLARNESGQLINTDAKLNAELRGPETYIAQILQEGTGTYTIVFDHPQVEGDFQLHVFVNNHEMYQWLIQLRSKQSHPGGNLQFLIDGPGLGGGRAGVQAYVNIKVRNSRNEPIDVDVHHFVVYVGVGFQEGKAKVSHVAKGVYRADFVVAKPGVVPIDVRYSGNSVVRPPLMATFW